jgi:hypothetical protein
LKLTTAGANERAGFIEAPQIGPANIASNAITAPIAAPATLHYLSVAALATVLVWFTGCSSSRRAWTVIFIGGWLGSNLITLGDPIWFHLPWDYAAGVLIYETVAWAILGFSVTNVCPKRNSAAASRQQTIRTEP